MRKFLVSLAIFILISHPAAAQQTISAPFPNDMVLDWDGQPIYAVGKIILTASPPDRPVYSLPEPTAKALKPAEIQEILADLLAWGPAQGRYMSYFFMLPAHVPFIDDMVAETIGVNPPVAVPKIAWLYPKFRNTTFGVTVQYQNDLASQKAFVGDYKKWAIFVTLSGFGSGVQVPYHVAEIFEGSFTNGLVTRLVLGEFARALTSNPRGDSFLDLNLGSLPPFPIDTDFRKRDAWGDKPYESALQDVLNKNSVQGAGILLGWMAASELMREPETRYLADVWKLISSRYTERDLGAMTAYTLNYLVGYSQNERMKQLKADGKDIGRLLESEKILPLLAQSTQNRLRALVNSGNELRDSVLLVTRFLFNRVISEFYAVGAAPNVSNREKLLAHYKAFLEGYQAGSEMAAEVLYYEVFRLGWGLGYVDGFRTGYDKGYAAGYKDGYASGYTQSWNAFTDSLGGLGRLIDGANSFLDKAGGIIGGIIAIASFF